MRKTLLILLALAASAFAQTKSVSPTGGGLNVTDNPAFRTALGGTTIGQNVFTLTNPSAITFPRFNADNTVSSLSAADFRTAIGATTVGANFLTLSNPSAITFPQINANNTVSALSASSYRTALGATTIGSSVFTQDSTVAISDRFFRVASGATTATLVFPDAVRTSLGGTTIGQSLFTLTNPSAITFPRFNANNTVTALDAASFRTAIGAGTGGTTLTDSASLAATISDETGTGLVVFGTSPTLTTPIINLGSDATGDIYYRNAGGLLTRLPVGTDGHYLTLTSGIPAWAAVAAGGLTNFTEAINTSAPNATIPVASLTAANAATDVDLAILSKANGALLRDIPDNTSTGGNKRGLFAVDLQVIRSTAAQVASGTDSFVMGRSCTASGTRSAVLGGETNQATNTNSVAIGGTTNVSSGQNSFASGGTGNTASGQNSSVTGGQNNTANATNSVVIGGTGNTASASTATVLGGSTNTADGVYSMASGFESSALTLYGVQTRATGKFSTAGDNQRMVFQLRRQTTGDTPAVLLADGSTHSATTSIGLSNSTIFRFRGMVVGRTSAHVNKTVEFHGAVKRDANAASTALIGSVTYDTLEDAGASTWVVSVAPNTTLGTLDITVTGEAATTIRWGATIEVMAVTY